MGSKAIFKEHGYAMNICMGSTQGWEYRHKMKQCNNYFPARGLGAEPLASLRPCAFGRSKAIFKEHGYGMNMSMGGNTGTGRNNAAIIRQPGVRGRSPWQAGDPVLQEWSERSSSPCRRHGS